MKRPLHTVVPFSRSYRRPKRFNMGLPPHRPRRSLWSRIVDPVFYLKLVVAISALGLVVLPFGVDAANAVLRPVAAEAGECRILTVIDGDTVSLWCEGRAPERARLVGFDAPELFSPRCSAELLAAEQAKWALRGMIFQADRITLRHEGRDRYDRALVDFTLDGSPLAKRMIAAGFARAYDGGKREGWC